jgi:hypothetical protein
MSNLFPIGRVRKCATNSRALLPKVNDSFIRLPTSSKCWPFKSARIVAGKKSSSQSCGRGIRPDQKMDRPPNTSYGLPPMNCCGVSVCRKLSAPECTAISPFGMRLILYAWVG